MKNIDHAIALAEAGFYVFPTREDGKEPLAGSHACHDATRDPDRIRELWAGNHDYNIAINPGMSGHTVVDVDPPHGEKTLDALTDEHECATTFRDTFQTRSPRGGIHYWFEGTTRSTTGVNGLGLNLDTRSISGYVLAPPSTVKGKPYEILNENDIQPLPMFVREMCAPRIKSPLASRGEADDQPHNIQLAIADVARFHPRKGQGADAEVYSCFCAVRDRGISGELALAIVSERCDLLWQSNTEEFLIAKRDHAYKYGQNEAGSRAMADPNTTFDISGATPIDVAAIQAERAEEKTKPIDLNKFNQDGKPRFYAYSLEEAEAFEEPSWLIPNLLPAKDTVMIFGPPKSFKSFLALDMCLGLGSGTKTFEYTPEKPYNILYIAGEGPSSISRKHVPAWCKVRGVDKKTISFKLVRRMIRIAQEGAVEEFIKQIEKQNYHPDVVIIDTMARASLGLEENSSKDMGLLVEAIDLIKNSLGTSVVAIHHTGKNTANGSRGSNAVEGAVATTLLVERHERSLAVKLTVKYQRDAAEREEPFYLMGEVVDNSVVFSPCEYSDYASIVKVESRTDRKFVHEALKKLEAVGQANGVPTTVLAMQIDPALEPGSKVLSEMERELRKAAAPSGRLEAYAEGRGHKMIWFIPGDA